MKRKFVLVGVVIIAIVAVILGYFTSTERFHVMWDRFKEFNVNVQVLPDTKNPETEVKTSSIKENSGDLSWWEAIRAAISKTSNDTLKPDIDASPFPLPHFKQELSVLSLYMVFAGIVWSIVFLSGFSILKRAHRGPYHPSRKTKPTRIQEVMLRPTPYANMLICELKHFTNHQCNLMEAMKSLHKRRTLRNLESKASASSYERRKTSDGESDNPQVNYLQMKCQELEARNTSLEEALTNLTEEVAKNDIASKSISKSSLTIASENRRLKSTIRSLQRDILSLKKEMGIATLNYRNELEEVIEAARIELDAKEIQIQELEQEQSTIKEELERLKEEFGNKEKTYQASQEELRQELAVAQEKLANFTEILKEAEANARIITDLQEQLKDATSSRDEALKILDQIRLGMEDSTRMFDSKENEKEAIDATPPRPNQRKRRLVDESPTSSPLQTEVNKSIWTPEHPTHKSLPLSPPRTTSNPPNEEGEIDVDYDGPADFSFTENGEVIDLEAQNANVSTSSAADAEPGSTRDDTENGW